MAELKITGIKRNTSLLNEKEGACNEIINLRYRNEQWEMIPKSKLLGTITVKQSDDILFRHTVLNPDYLILWSSTGELSLVSISSGTYVGTKGKLGTFEGIKKIEEFGVILVLISDTEVYYLRYDEKTSAYNYLKPLTHGRYSFYDDGREQFGSKFTPVNTDKWVEEGLINALERRKALELMGKTNGHVFFRAAFKTKDGGFINYSPVYYRNIGFTESDTSDEAVPNIRYDGTNYYFSWGNWAYPSFKLEFEQEQFDAIANYSGFIESFCIFMSKPQYDWDITAGKGGMVQIADGSKEYYFYPHTQEIKDYFVNNQEFYLVKEIPFADLANHSGTYGGSFTADTNTAVALPSPPPSFKHVEITRDSDKGHYVYEENTDYTIDYTAKTITALPYRDVSDEEHFITVVGYPVQLDDKNLFGSCYVTLDDGTNVNSYFTIDYPNGTATLNDSSIGKQNFHFQYQAGMQDGVDYVASFGVNLSGKLDVGDLAQFETKQTLPVNNFTNHRYFSQVYYEYNSRIHYGAVRTRLGDIPNITIYDETDQGHLPDGYTKVQDDNNKSFDFDVLVTIITDVGEKKVLTKLSKIGIYNDSTNDFSALNPLITYPDQRARKLSVYAYDTGFHTLMTEINLKPHPWLNLAYYIPDASIDSVDVTYGSNTQTKRILRYYMLPLTPVSDNVLAEDDRIVTETNRIQVSEVNNPLIFPAKNSYRIGRISNEITGLASQAFPVSTGQFGQYPVYVGSTQGIFALQQGTTVLYGAVVPVSSYSVKSFTKTEAGILFTTEQSVYLITGSQISRISTPLEGNPDFLINGLSSFSDTLTNFPINLSYHDLAFYSNNFKAGFNPVLNEIILSPPEDYSYIFSIESGIWYKSSFYYRDFMTINGKFCGISGSNFNEIYDLNETDGQNLNVYIITRPQKFGAFELKSISRFAARIFSNLGNGMNLHLYGSLNGKEWKLIQGINETDYLHAGKGIGAIVNTASATARYFIFMLASNSQDMFFSGFDVDVEVRQNQKIR